MPVNEEFVSGFASVFAGLLQVVGFTADPVDDNIYQWSVKMFNFAPGR